MDETKQAISGKFQNNLLLYSIDVCWAVAFKVDKWALEEWNFVIWYF